MSLREAASVVFGLAALLPIMLLVALLSRYDILRHTDALLFVLLALVVSVLGFVVFRRMVDQVARLAQGLQAPAATRAATADVKPAAVPGLGRVAEIGQVADAFHNMLDDLRTATQRLEDLVFKLGTLNEMVELAARIPRIQELLGLVLQTTMRAVRATASRARWWRWASRCWWTTSSPTRASSSPMPRSTAVARSFACRSAWATGWSASSIWRSGRRPATPRRPASSPSAIPTFSSSTRS